jgi:hypothetical protein
MGKLKDFLIGVEEEFSQHLEETTNDVALQRIEKDHGTMAREHCVTLLNEWRMADGER